MPAFRRRAWILSASLLATVACKSELDDKPAADPLEDPWVDALDEDPALADDAPASPSEPAAAPGEAQPEAAPVLALAEAGEPAAVAEPTAEPAAGVLASPSATRSAAGPSAAGAAPPSTPEQAAAEAAPPSAEAPVAEAPVAEPSPPAEAKPAEPAAPPPITIADFHGNYKYVGGSAQRADLDAAIEVAVEQLPAAFRGIGRKRLTKTNPIDSTLDIVVAGDKVQTIFETGFDANCIVDGATVHWTSQKGDQYKVRVRAKGSKIVQIIEGEDGVKTTVFVLSADRQKLTVHHKITADRLPEPMTYRLSYSRK